MKLIIAILRDEDSEPVSTAMIEAGFRATRIASTGGLLRRGSTTMMVGVEDDRIDEAMQVVRAHVSAAAEPGMRRATLFVVKVDRFVQV
ncbi:MAG TPA: cyclic-di-AMP receptor [Anaerolineales bacterium]|jgi:uncharacterized protein YaaQ|nr:cyclic-di-AMP receptor [Anaerolineales bacterium]